MTKKIAFLFPGQGSQAVGMGADLYQEFDFVREIFDMASDTAKKNMADLCFKGPMEALTETVNLQPAVTAMNLSCLAVLEKEGVRPRFAAGHSLGEFSALNAAGVCSRPDTLHMVHHRGVLMHQEATAHKGAMQAIVGLTIDAVSKLVAEAAKDGIVSVANHNAETQIVITGTPEAVKKAGAMAKAQGARAIPLKVSGAWHSELIRGAEPTFKDVLEAVPFSAPTVDVLHNVTADTVATPTDIRTIMATQLCSPVRWYDTMMKLIKESVDVYVEVGPGKVLTGLLKKTLPKNASVQVFNVNTLKTVEAFFNALA